MNSLNCTICQTRAPMRRSVLLLCAALAMCVAAGSVDARQKFISFDVPGATDTIAYSINAAGSVAGVYYGKNGPTRAFVRAPDGQTFDTFLPKGASSIVVQSINNAGTVVGWYVSGEGAHAFLRTSDGTFTDITPCQLATGINNKGFVVGSCASGGADGFVRDPDGNVTTFVPDGGSFIVPFCINSSGEVAGRFDAGRGVRSFVRDLDGTITTYDVAKGTTYATCISDAGTSVGYYGKYITHGFLRARDGKITTFDPPEDGWAFVGISPGGINSNDWAVGSYQNRDGTWTHGYLRTPDGTMTTYDPFGSIEVDLRTINKKGVIAGSYRSPDGHAHGLVITGVP